MGTEFRHVNYLALKYASSIIRISQQFISKVFSSDIYYRQTS